MKSAAYLLSHHGVLSYDLYHAETRPDTCYERHATVYVLRSASTALPETGRLAVGVSMRVPWGSETFSQPNPTIMSTWSTTMAFQISDTDVLHSGLILVSQSNVVVGRWF